MIIILIIIILKISRSYNIVMILKAHKFIFYDIYCEFETWFWGQDRVLCGVILIN